MPPSPKPKSPPKPGAQEPIVDCATLADWRRWLDRHHVDASGVWLKLAKKRSGHPTVDYQELLNEAICHGWIDARRESHDDSFFLQRFTPRGPRSKWSQVNRAKATAMIEQGRMREAGLAQVQAAQADGRWEAAYEPQSRATIPDDFQEALDQNAVAKAFFATLKGTRRYAFLYRLHNVRTPAKRAERIANYIVLLNEHRTLN